MGIIGFPAMAMGRQRKKLDILHPADTTDPALGYILVVCIE